MSERWFFNFGYFFIGNSIIFNPVAFSATVVDVGGDIELLTEVAELDLDFV